MPLLIDNPPFTIDASTWPGLMLYAATILLEAEAEPDEGKVAVAWVIRTRMDLSQKTVHQVILGADEKVDDDGHPYEAFSCWNDDYVAQRRSRLTAPDPKRWETCWRAACGAYWKLLVDPVDGATHYLNIPLTRQIRGGSLPQWAEFALRRGPGVIIGRHTFLKI